MKLKILAVVVSVLSLFAGVSMSSEDKAFKKQRLAVIGFESKNTEESVLQSVTELVQGRFENSGLYIMIERDKIDKVLKEQAFQLSGAVDDNTAVSLGKLLGAEKLVLGGVNKLENEYLISGRIVNAETGEIEITAAESAKNVLDIKESVDKLVKSMVEKDRTAYQEYLRSMVYANSLRLNIGYLMVTSEAKDFASNPTSYYVSYRRKGIPFIKTYNTYTELEAGFFRLKRDKDLPPAIEYQIDYMPVSINAQYYMPLSFFVDVYGKAGAGCSYGKSSLVNYVLNTEINEVSIDPFMKAGIGLDMSKNYKWGFHIEALYNHYFLLDVPLTGITFTGGISYNW